MGRASRLLAATDSFPIDVFFPHMVTWRNGPSPKVYLQMCKNDRRLKLDSKIMYFVPPLSPPPPKEPCPFGWVGGLVGIGYCYLLPPLLLPLPLVLLEWRWAALVSFVQCAAPQAVGRQHFAINHFVPLLLGLPDDDPMRQQAEWFIRSEVGTEAINVGQGIQKKKTRGSGLRGGDPPIPQVGLPDATFMSSYCHWVFPALLGFNRHTFATFAIVYVALSGAAGNNLPRNK